MIFLQEKLFELESIRSQEPEVLNQSSTAEASF